MPVDKLVDSKPSELKAEIIYKCLIEGKKQVDIAEELQCSPQYINSVVKPIKSKLLTDKEVTEVKQNYNKLLWSANTKLLIDLMDDDKRGKASLNNTAYAQASLNNQIRLDEDKSTNNTQIFDIVEERKRIEEEQEKLKNTS